MNRRILASIVVIVVALAGFSRAQNQSRDSRTTPQAGSPAPTGTSSLSGVVVANATKSPVRLASVVLIGTNTGLLRVSATDASGRFSFDKLPADRYVVGASKQPYLGAVAGAKRPARAGTPIAVGDGQRVSNVTINLPRSAAIGGIVTDDRGRPAASVQVTLMQVRVGEVERTLVPGPGSAYTDDRGRYRIYGLVPGEYFVSVNPTSMFQPSFGVKQQTEQDVDAALRAAASTTSVSVTPGGVTPAVAPVPVPQAPSQAYSMVYYPGTPRVSDAAPVVLAEGEDRDNVDIRLQLLRTARVEGVVTGFDQAQPTGAMFVRALPSIGGGTAARMLSDGRFAFGGLAPGSYTLLAQTLGGASNSFAMAAIEITGADVSGVQLTLQSLLSVDGRVIFDGASPPSSAGLRVPLRMYATSLPQQQVPSVTPTSASGAFKVTGMLPGRYLIGGPPTLGATTAAMTWAFDSVIVDGRDATDLPIEISPTSTPKEIVVTYSDRSQELSGRLQAPGGTASDYTIVLFSANKGHWYPQTRRIITARAGTDGQFKFGGPGPASLPAGDYLLAAVSDLERDEQFDPTLLAALKQAAVPVSVKPGAKVVQNLTIRQ